MPYKALVAGRYSGAPKTWEKLTHETPVWPGGLYGCSKVFGEALARHFTDTSDLSILCLRIGSVYRDDRPQEARDFSVWCSHRDIAQMIDQCIEAPASPKFDVFYAVSNNRWGFRDLEHVREVLGFVPKDAAEDHR